MTPPPLPIGSLTLLPFLGCNCSLTAFPWWLTVRWPTAPKSSSCSRCGTFALVCSHCPPPWLRYHRLLAVLQQTKDLFPPGDPSAYVNVKLRRPPRPTKQAVAGSLAGWAPWPI